MYPNQVRLFSIIFLLIISKEAFNQDITSKISMEEAVKIALLNNPLSKNAFLKEKNAEIQIQSFDFDATELNYQHGKINSSFQGEFFEIYQPIGSPTNLIYKNKVNKQNLKLAQAEHIIASKQITANVKKAYNNLVFSLNKKELCKEMNQIYEALLSITGVPYSTDDTSLLNKTNLETLYANFQNQQFQEDLNYNIAQNEIQLLLNSTDPIIPVDSLLELYAIKMENSGINKFEPINQLKFYKEVENLRKKELNLEKSKLFPQIGLGYFEQKFDDIGRFNGITVGVNIPLWYFPQKTKISLAKINTEIAKNEFDYQNFYLEKKIESLKVKLDQLFVQNSFYRENSLKHADLLIKNVLSQLQKKEINYLISMEYLELALKINFDYLNNIKIYNETAIELEFFIN